MHFEIDLWYKEVNPKKPDDAKYLYQCKYFDSTIAVLKKYYDGACISSFSTPIITKKYTLSDTGSLNQRMDFYKRDKFNALCEIGNHLLEITHKIGTIEELDQFFLENKPDYIPSLQSKSIDKEYEETKQIITNAYQIDEIIKFFKIS